MSSAANATSAGRPAATSFAKLGPDRNVSRSRCGARVSANTSLIKPRVESSIPLAVEVTRAPSGIRSQAFSDTRRMNAEGTVRSTSSASANAWARSLLKRIAAGTGNPGR
jgi:hypothetical protein